MTTYESTSGSIVHIELASDEPDETRAFFEDVFDWTFEEMPEMEYLSFSPPNPPGGGIMTGEADGPFTPPPTLLYVNVEDLAETDEAIEAAGGEILVEAMEVPEMGVFTIFRDPGGVVEAAWEDRYEGEPPEGGWPQFTDQPEAGSITHVELYSEDPAATRAFHETVFGWTVEEMDDGEYLMFRPPTPPYGGIMEATDEMPAGTLLYLLADDAEEAIDAIDVAGGDVLREPFPIEGWGTMAVFGSPGGPALAVWESTTEEEAAGADERPEHEVAG